MIVYGAVNVNSYKNKYQFTYHKSCYIHPLKKNNNMLSTFFAIGNF